MNEQKITVATRTVEIILSNGAKIKGEAFLQLHSFQRKEELQRIGEVLNGDENFFPLQGDHGVELINLEQVVSVATAAAEEVDPLLELGAEHHIQVEPTHGEKLQVRIFVNLPGDRTRVKDFLNQRTRFLHFIHGDQVLYIARNRIMRVWD